MAKLNFTDAEIASFVTYRTLAVMVLALPFGMLIKKRKIKPFYYFSAIGVPVCTFLYVYGAEIHSVSLVRGALTLFGFCHMVSIVCGLPFILRNADDKTHTEAISLNYATWSMGMIAAGILMFGLSAVSETLFTEDRVIQLVALFSFSSLYFLYAMGEEQLPEQSKQSGFNFSQYDWGDIIKCVTPTLLIAVGAGLIIPFINLFFFHVFGLDSEIFAILGSFAAFLVASVALVVPQIKRRYGYKAITVTQSLAVLALVGLATTEYFPLVPGMVVVAILFYLVRQPLMNMAGPLTSEMTMYYVGEKNREILSALMSAIWSGSWFFSSIVFGILRNWQFKFSSIFYITAALYVVGVLLFYLLIKDYFKREMVSD